MSVTSFVCAYVWACECVSMRGCLHVCIFYLFMLCISVHVFVSVSSFVCTCMVV